MVEASVKNGVCLWCGSGVLENGDHVDARPPCSDLQGALNEAERWKERTRYLLTTDPDDWMPEVVKWWS